MGAKHPLRRNVTAQETARRLGISVRQARRVVSEPRTEFLARAAERRERAAELRRQGFKYADIAIELGCSIGTVSGLLAVARRHGVPTEATSTAVAS